MGGLVTWALAGTLGGALSGIAQWFVLKRQISRAGWWALASTLGWAAASLLVAVIIVTTDPGKYIYMNELMETNLIFPGAVVGILGGAITGIVLVWLLRQPVPDG